MLERLRVLLLTHESVLRSTRSAILERHGYRPLQALTVPEALDVLRFEQIDAILLDETVAADHRAVLLDQSAVRRIPVILLHSDRCVVRVSGRPLVTYAAPGDPNELLEVIGATIRPRVSSQQAAS